MLDSLSSFFWSPHDTFLTSFCLKGDSLRFWWAKPNHFPFRDFEFCTLDFIFFFLRCAFLFLKKGVKLLFFQQFRPKKGRITGKEGAHFTSLPERMEPICLVCFLKIRWFHKFQTASSRNVKRDFSNHSQAPLSGSGVSFHCLAN